MKNLEETAASENLNRYLLGFRKDVTSQFGEDGIIEKIFDIIKPETRWCVEFGAWDGKHFSNTYALIHDQGWSAVLIEGDADRCREIAETHAGKPVTAVNTFVGWEGPGSLDAILAGTPIPKNFDFLSVDIDGNDLQVWKALVEYRPKVVCIEFNAFIPGNIEFVQPADPKVRQGNSILSMTKLAREKGYELVCINQENAFYVEREYFPLFGIKDNSITSLKHYAEPLQVYQLYDGTFRFHGAQWLYYYGIPVDLNKKFQILPEWLRSLNIPWGKQNFFFTLILRFFRRINRPDKPTDGWGWKSRY